VKLIVQAVAADENHTVELYRRGVRGIISRSISPDLLVRCVRRIAAGETWIDNQSVNWVIEAYRAQAAALVSPRNQPRLSPKEMSIITCITQGKRNKEIAFQLGTTEQVIKNYLRKIYDKLGVSDRLELALYCLHNKIIQTDADEVTVAPDTRRRKLFLRLTIAAIPACAPPAAGSSSGSATRALIRGRAVPRYALNHRIHRRSSSGRPREICVNHHAAVVPVAVLADQLEPLQPRQQARDVGLGGDHAAADG
jgi:DNA-binding CsgD family transcriptional regulator